MARNFDDSVHDAFNAGAAILSGAPFSVSAWIKTDDGGDDHQVIGGISQAGTDNGWKWRLRHSSGRIDFEAERTAPNASGRASTTAVPAVGTWAHASATEAASDDRRAYLNGANKGTNSTTVVPQSMDDTEIAQRDDGSPGDAFSGDIGRYTIYGVTLDDQAHETLAAGFNPLQYRRDDILGHYPLNGQTPEPNVMGTGFDMTAIGTPSVVEGPPVHHSLIAPG